MKVKKFEKRSPFFGNFFIVNKKRQHLFVSISKCGCSTLKTITAIENNLVDRELNDSEDIHKVFGAYPKPDRLIDVKSHLYANFLRVAFYRDPVSRFISWYDNKVLEQHPPFTLYTGTAHNPSLDKAIDLLEFELNKEDPLWMDEHLRPQHLCYQMDEIDIVIPIAEMDDYLQYLGSDVEVRQNKRTIRQKTTPSRKQLRRIRFLYSKDYEHIKRIQSKRWSSEIVQKISARF